MCYDSGQNVIEKRKTVLKLQVKQERGQPRDEPVRAKPSVATKCTGLAAIVSAPGLAAILSTLATFQLGCSVGRWNDGLVLCCAVWCLLLLALCVLDSRDMWRSIIFSSSKLYV